MILFFSVLCYNIFLTNYLLPKTNIYYVSIYLYISYLNSNLYRDGSDYVDEDHVVTVFILTNFHGEVHERLQVIL